MTPLCVAPGHVASFWPHVSHFIKSAMVRGGLTEFSEIEQAVLLHRMHLWLVLDGTSIAGALITQLNAINGEKIGTIVACGGKGLDQFSHLITGLEKYFRDEGCKFSRIMGRPGWSRMYPDYMMKAIVLEKAL